MWCFVSKDPKKAKIQAQSEEHMNKRWQNESPHDNTNKSGMSAQQRHRSACSSAKSDQSSLCTQWVAKDPSFLHADSEDSDQTGLMQRLISLRRANMPFCWFCHEVAQIIMKCNIGIKHGFSCINSRQVPWEMLKTEAKGPGFQHLQRDLVNVNALKNHVWSLLLHKNWKHLLHFAFFSCSILFRLFTDVVQTLFPWTMLVLGQGSTHLMTAAILWPWYEKCQILFSGKNKKNINLSSAETAQREVKVNHMKKLCILGYPRHAQWRFQSDDCANVCVHWSQWSFLLESVVINQKVLVSFFSYLTGETYFSFCLCWGFTAQSTQWGHVERGQFT